MLPVYVINLDRRPDRWAIMSAQLEHLGIEAERIAAVDGNKVVADEDWERALPFMSPLWQVDPGQGACLLSHGLAMQAFLAGDAPAALILEDDAVLAADTPSLLRDMAWWPAGARIVRLNDGGDLRRPIRRSPGGRTPTKRTLHRVERWCPGAVAYIVDRRGAEMAMKAIAAPSFPVDYILFNLRVSKAARRLRPLQIVPAMAGHEDNGLSDLQIWRDAKRQREPRRTRSARETAWDIRVRLLRASGFVKKVWVTYSETPPERQAPRNSNGDGSSFARWRAEWIKAIPRRLLPKNKRGDTEFCRRRFLQRQGRLPDPDGAGRLTDIIYRIKTDGTLFDPLIQFVTDKEYAKDYIDRTLGPGYTPETRAVLRTREEVRAFAPDRAPCVLKPTHLSGPVLFHTEAGAPVDRETLLRWLRKRRYAGTREGNYRHLRPKVIVEEFLSEDGVTVPKDYKLFCFDGVPKMIQVDSDRFGGHTQNFYDLDWNRLPFTYGTPSGPEDDERPAQLDEILTLSRKLAAPFRFVRVDLYVNEKEIRVGELTFVPQGANVRLLPEAADIDLARLFEPDYRLDAAACAEAWRQEVSDAKSN